MINKENELCPDKLKILVTDADLHGYEISKMSDFMGLYAHQLTQSLSRGSHVEAVSSIPVADIAIINEVVQQAAAIFKGNTILIPDFNSLPRDIKYKLKTGKYSIAESKQVDGNLRAVIIDENKVRVKDITLKKVVHNPGTLEAMRSIALQMQMKQIQNTLSSIQEIQSYQSDRDRDRDILVPFFDARDYISRAQNAESTEKRDFYLEKASDRLTTALNSVYTDIRTSTKHLAKITKWPIFQDQSTIELYLSYLTDDLQYATKFSGVQMHVLEALGRRADAQETWDRYRAFLLEFNNKKLKGRDISAIELIHDNYHYSRYNRDSWYKFSRKLGPTLKNAQMSIDDRQTYIVSVEDSNDE